MENDTATEAAASKKKKAHWLLWWKIEPDELQKQVTEYRTLKVHQSARGISALCLLVSAGITAIFTATKTAAYTDLSYVDAVIPLFFCIFIYRGHRWAMILAMIYWSLAKAFQIVTLFNSPQPNAGIVISVLLWWAGYMHAFYLAFKTEQARRAAASIVS